jgi:hypothetical protein
MIRTVWLALFCLIGLGAAASLRIAMSMSDSGDISPARTVAAASPAQNTLAKADKLEVTYIDEAPGKKLVKSIDIRPPETASKPPEKVIKIVSRHWHNAYAKRIARRRVGLKVKTPK